MDELLTQLAFLFDRYGIDPFRVLTIGTMLFTFVEAVKSHLPVITGKWSWILAGGLSVGTALLAFGTASLVATAVGALGIFLVASGVNRAFKKTTTTTPNGAGPSSASTTP